MKKIYALVFVFIGFFSSYAGEIDSIEKFIKEVDWEKFSKQNNIDEIKKQFENPFFIRLGTKLLNNEIQPSGGNVLSGQVEYEVAYDGKKNKITLSSANETAFLFMMDCWIINAKQKARINGRESFINSLKELIAFVQMFSAVDNESFIYALDIRRITGLQFRIAQVLLENNALLSADDINYFRSEKILVAKRRMSDVLRVETPIKLQNNSTDVLITSLSLLSYFQRNGAYPEKIEQLSPDYMNNVPSTIIYERSANGFVLKGEYGPVLNIPSGRNP